MKKIYALIILCISMFAFSANVFAEGEDYSSVKLSKVVADNGDGTYTITLETFITGESVTVTQPYDICLVLDHSRSMESAMSGGGGNRRPALIAAVNAFVDNVYANATKDPNHPVDHRIAMLDYYGGGSDCKEGNITAGTYHDLLTTITGASAGLNSVLTHTTTSGGTTTCNLKLSNSNFGANDGSNTGTNAATGLTQADPLLFPASEAGTAYARRQKIIVFFTDGNCGSGTDWTSNNRSYAKTVVVQSNALKAKGAKLYAVGTFGEAESKNPETFYYMNHVSSGYNTTISHSDHTREVWVERYYDRKTKKWIEGHYETETYDYFDTKDNGVDMLGPKSEGFNNKYFYIADNADDLKNIFTEISHDIEAVDLTETSAVVLDCMTDSFKLPDNVQTSDIKLYTCSIQPNNYVASDPYPWFETGTGGFTVYKDSKNNVIAFNPTQAPAEYASKEYWMQITNTSSMITIGQDSEGQDEIQVTGFNYKTHFVGPVEYKEGTQTKNKWNPDGQKLIIQFDIIIDPTNAGGIDLKTNKISSGIYTRDKQGHLSTDPIKKYDQPVVYLPYLKVTKTGLKAGESATFKITKVTGNNSTTAATTDAFTCDIILVKTGNADPFAVVKLRHAGWYRVEETSWSWTYDKANDQWGELKTKKAATTETQQEYLTFEFTNTPKTSTPKHAEAAVINNMSDASKKVAVED